MIRKDRQTKRVKGESVEQTLTEFNHTDVDHRTHSTSSNQSSFLTDHDKLPPIWWSNAIFFISVHAFAVFGIIFIAPVHKVSIINLILCWTYCQLGTFGITIGYHRLWSHRAFVAIEPFRWFLVFAASFGFQGSVRWWVLRHRLHHRWTDSEDDPYNAKKGLLFSHMGWIFRKPKYEKLKLVDRSDLDRDRVPLVNLNHGLNFNAVNMDLFLKQTVVNFQHRYYIPISVIIGFVLPHFLSTYIFKCNTHSTWDGLIWGGFVSRLIIWHLTFFINSLAHYVGDQLFDLDITARSNFWLAIFTCGEANHNYHHVFPRDYRNGPATLDWDPTKWIIYLLYTYTPLVTKIYLTPPEEIELARKRVLRLTRLAPRPSLKVGGPRWFPSLEDLFSQRGPEPSPTCDSDSDENTSLRGSQWMDREGVIHKMTGQPTSSLRKTGLTLLPSSASESDSDFAPAQDKSPGGGVSPAHSISLQENEAGDVNVIRSRHRSIPSWSKAQISQHLLDYLVGKSDQQNHLERDVSTIRTKLQKSIILLIDGYLLDVTTYAYEGNHPGGIKILRQYSIIRPAALLSKCHKDDISANGDIVELSSRRDDEDDDSKRISSVIDQLATDDRLTESNDSWMSGYQIEWIDSSDAFYVQLNQHSWPARQKMKQFRIAKLVP
ncbi:uncharacterized protein MELLADRAFT_90937 [Melampsora larici-populina 98AG31]|uniref:Fatty acid desaturase domain-containing protein n=1 Tax=Melampsora larici-populina (strain 98AG31 / pathotype 3-4-7) TaxID=747676 RepID=F4R841_MELLP|nr:uncharacterized protein MELLADRAFT_90937 [Melampsora larici-populina 98AG31]EGG11681.1 hypothetical protein MELLADRAFT_90937 [Melampsora larici-populina 98AG31]